MTLKVDVQYLNSRTAISPPIENTSTENMSYAMGWANNYNAGLLAWNTIIKKCQSSAVL